MFLKGKIKAFLGIMCLVLAITFFTTGPAQAALSYYGGYTSYKSPYTSYTTPYSSYNNYYKYPYYYYPKTTTTTPTTQPTTTPTTQPTTTPTTTQYTVLAAEEQQMLNLINQERTSRGLKSLSMDSRLTSVARDYSKEMVANNFFSHTSAVDGSSPFDRIKRAGISYRYAGENLAYNSSVTAAHQALMNSDSHRKNILNPNFTQVGIGIVKKSSSQIMIAQEFIGI